MYNILVLGKKQKTPKKQSLCHKTIQFDIFSSNVERSSSVCITLHTELVIASYSPINQEIDRFM